nr:MAG TPA: hypothetical protein [Caudoviricetes sp.]
MTLLMPLLLLPFPVRLAYIRLIAIALPQRRQQTDV